MKGLRTATLIFTMFFFFVGMPTFASEYKKGEVLVKYSSSSMLSSMVAEGMESRPAVVAVDDTAEGIENFSDRGDVAYVEPNYLVEVEEVPSDWAYSSWQWVDTGLEDAWAHIGTDMGNEVVIALIDSGVDLDHPDLQNILVSGYDFINNDSCPDDDYHHGTRVAGIIAAQANNDIAYAGVAWNIDVKIMPLKFLGSDGKGYISDAVDAIYYAVDHGADIINASWGFTSYSNALKDAIDYARANGVLFIASAGNSSQDNDEVAHYPSNFTMDNVIAVAAMNNYGDLASFSNYGYYSVDVAAPGQGLKTTDNDGGVCTWASGTSYAAPFVSAVAGMVISQSPELGYNEVRDRIVRTSIIDGDDYTNILVDAGGCVNAYNAITGEGVHDIADKSAWEAPATQKADASSTAIASNDSDGGAQCFVAAAGSPGYTWIFVLLMVTLSLMFRHGQRE